MKIEIHHHYHCVDEQAIMAALERIEQRTEDMSATDQEILDKVTELTTVQEGMATLLDEVAQIVRDEGDNSELADRIDALIESGKAAVLRNTDVDPTP